MTIKSITQSLNERLGADTTFPINGNFKNIQGLDLLLQDIQLLLLTVPGERVGDPTFGCSLRNQVWENIDTVAIHGKGSIKSAIDAFEPRIQLTSVASTVNRNTGLIIFKIKFIVLSTDVVANLVFPFRTAQQVSA